MFNQKKVNYWCKKGEQSYDKKDYKNSISFFNNALALNSLCVRALNGKGLVLFNQDHFDAAFSCFIKALAIDNIDPLALGSSLHIANVFFNERAFNKAYCCFAEVLKHAPNNVDALKGKKNAINSAEKLKAKNIDANNKGISLCKENKLKEGLPYFLEALRLYPNDQSVINNCLRVVNNLFDQRLYNESTEGYADIYESNPDHLSITTFWWNKVKELYTPQEDTPQKDDETSNDIDYLNPDHPSIILWDKVDELLKPQKDTPQKDDEAEIVYKYALSCALTVDQHIMDDKCPRPESLFLPKFQDVSLFSREVPLQSAEEFMRGLLQENEKTEDEEEKEEDQQHNYVSACLMTTPSQSKAPSTRVCSTSSTTQAFFKSSSVERSRKEKKHEEDNHSQSCGSSG